MVKLQGQIALVTGASRGIGQAAAEALAQAGAAVMLAARDGALAAKVADGIAAAGGRAAGLAGDVSDFASVTRLVAATRERFGGLDILVNNAGVIQPIGPVWEADPQDWARNIDINLTGAFHGVRAVLPAMVAAGGGTIINVSSGAAHRPLEGWSAYCSAKAGLAMLTRSIAQETKGRGIRIFGFSPGTVDTEMQVKIRASGINPVSKIPRGDLQPVDRPARAVVYLCTAAADDLIGEEASMRDEAFVKRLALG
ncbi:SDR family oxidoreductase [Desertibaculum subflavum]|uniref:SDR family oxidoreductase n=1 Tax=Desertibaculum subflavum TaxID=2268458 RepID=UPI000E65EBE8